MTATIDYFFDYASPYSYLATPTLRRIAQQYQAQIVYRPMLLGAIFKVTGSAPLTQQSPFKAQYSLHDFERTARFVGLPFKMPTVFPMLTQNIGRATLWVGQTAPMLAGDFVQAAGSALFAHDQAINELEVISQLAQSIGLDGQAAAASTSDPLFKDALKHSTDLAIEKGVFGAPWFSVGNEHFWGQDRLPQLEQWLKSGGF